MRPYLRQIHRPVKGILRAGIVNVSDIGRKSPLQKIVERPLGVGASLLISVHHGGEAPDLESPPMKYPKRSRYKYAKSRYRVGNWPEYEAGLQRRGNVTVWLSDEALDSWADST